MSRKPYFLLSVHLIFFICFVMSAVRNFLFMFTPHTTLPDQIWGIDFSIFYAASQLTLAGHADWVYNINTHHYMIESIYSTYIPDALPYFYPPYSLFLFAPLSLLPYSASCFTWMFFTLALFVLLVHKIFHNKLLVVMSLSFPGLLLNLRWCQNAFLTTTLLLVYIHYITRKPTLAGIAVGLLCYKPQIALFCLIATVALRNWKCLQAACLTVSILTLGSLIVFGTSTWNDYFQLLAQFKTISITSGWLNTRLAQPTVYSLLRLSGITSAIALYLQYAISLLMAILTVVVWRKRQEGDPFPNIILVLAILIGLPYYIQYDLFIAIIPFLYWKMDVCKQPHPPWWEVVLISLLWLIPILSWIVANVAYMQVAPILFLGLLFIAILRNHQRQGLRANL